MEQYKFQVGHRFSSPQQFREVLRDWIVRNGYDLAFAKNENARITAKCKNETCTWRIHASPAQDGSEFQVKTLCGEHVCARKVDSTIATSSYLSKRILQDIKQDPDISMLRLQDIIRAKCGLEVGSSKVARAKKKALEIIRGANDKQYAELWDYCATLRKYNPDSTIYLKKVDYSEPPTFERMYVSLDGMKNEWRGKIVFSGHFFCPLSVWASEMHAG